MSFTRACSSNWTRSLCMHSQSHTHPYMHTNTHSHLQPLCMSTRTCSSILFYLGHIACTRCIDVDYCYRCCNCSTVCVLDTTTSCAKTAEPIDSIWSADSWAIGPTIGDITSSTKLKVHKLLQHFHRMTKPRPQAVFIEILAKFRHAVPEICMQTDRQTDKQNNMHAHHHTLLFHSGEVIIQLMQLSQMIQHCALLWILTSSPIVCTHQT